MTTSQLETNIYLQTASDFIKYTQCSVYLTGKAGTGKTTFLKSLKELTPKNQAIIAPTGVAAINAGGVTIHSFFQLPFGLYLPESVPTNEHSPCYNKAQLFRNLRFNKDKIELLNELELLIIDEVSMVRADVMQAINDVLQYVRRSQLPFGGIQVAFIGDLYQLPPVVQEHEVELMASAYTTPYFFSAPIIKQQPPVYIELKEVYRQSDETFVTLLNKIRTNQLTPNDLALLNGRHHINQTNKQPITLTTHNRIADEINQRELQNLPGKTTAFTSQVKGDFNEKSYPTEATLHLKAGARVMFVKNDSSYEKRYYNGKLATVKQVTSSVIRVQFDDNEELFEVEREQWTNVRYVLNATTNKLETEELGSFSQYPLRLAWAITIHKSQGLTFDQVSIDAGQAFAPGQVYVALSRCRSLQGIQLNSPITLTGIYTDLRVAQFAQEFERSIDTLQELLALEKPKYAASYLINAFKWNKILDELNHYQTLLKTQKNISESRIAAVGEVLSERAKKHLVIVDKFTKQLAQILHQQPLNETLLIERVCKAKHYFAQLILNDLIKPLDEVAEYLNGRVKVTQFAKENQLLINFLWNKITQIESIAYDKYTFEVSKLVRPTKSVSIKEKNKIPSKNITLQFYKQGLSVSEIAKQRGITTATVENHLADFVASGDVNILDFLSPNELEDIKKVLDQHKANNQTITLTAIKQQIGEAIDFPQLKMGVNYWLHQK